MSDGSAASNPLTPTVALKKFLLFIFSMERRQDDGVPFCLSFRPEYRNNARKSAKPLTVTIAATTKKTAAERAKIISQIITPLFIDFSSNDLARRRYSLRQHRAEIHSGGGEYKTQQS